MREVLGRCRFSRHIRGLLVVTQIPFKSESFLTKKVGSNSVLKGKILLRLSASYGIIRLKQAVEEPCRRVGQRSAVLILDSRMASKRYGKQISKSWLEAIVLESLAENKFISMFKNF